MASNLYTHTSINAGDLFIEESDEPVSASDLKALGKDTVASLVEIGALSETPKYANVDALINRDQEIERLRALLEANGIDVDAAAEAEEPVADPKG